MQINMFTFSLASRGECFRMVLATDGISFRPRKKFSKGTRIMYWHSLQTSKPFIVDGTAYRKFASGKMADVLQLVLNGTIDSFITD